MNVASHHHRVAVSKEVLPEELAKILRYHVWASIGSGLVPIPGVDLALLTGVQINLLRELSRKYQVPFFQHVVREAISSVVSSAIPFAVAPVIAASLIKCIPLAGQTIGVLTLPTVAGAATYALGKVFIQHFASGGTFLTFQPDKVKAYYAKMFAEGERFAEELKQAKEPAPKN